MEQDQIETKLITNNNRSINTNKNINKSINKNSNSTSTVIKSQLPVTMESMESQEYPR